MPIARRAANKTIFWLKIRDDILQSRPDKMSVFSGVRGRRMSRYYMIFSMILQKLPILYPHGSHWIPTNPEEEDGVLAIGCNDWNNTFVLASQHEERGSDDHKTNNCLCCEIFVVKRPSFHVRRSAQLGSTTNWLFLGCLELISEFDPFHPQHLTKYGNKGKGSTSYLSSDICSEFIDVMGKRILEEILGDQIARYISLIIHSTPDASYTNQQAVALQYVSVREACANECLVLVLSGVSHEAQGMEEAALNLLEELKLDLKNSQRPKLRQCF
ncbi:DUF4371 domain-containing protein [Trichonephila clavipes]|nr:DUF4371 domain-containing protein [Trichonephila clavipes]